MNNSYPYLINFLEARDSELHGMGLFTKRDLFEGDIICVIEGEVIDGNECERREEEEGNVYIFWNGDNYIDTSNNPLLRNINHVCEPNCYVDDRDEHSLFLIADCNIKAGSELTIDYDYEEIYQHCRCNTCRSGKEEKPN
jgi:hypothetical protein